MIDANSSEYSIGPTNDGRGVVVYTNNPNDEVYDLLFEFEAIEFNDRTIVIDDGLFA